MSATLLDRLTPIVRAPIVDDATRRQFLAGLAAAGLLAGCGSGPSGSDAAPAGSGGFPVTIAHQYGSTSIPTKPQRIVTVGLTEQDALLALGEVPVAPTEWFGEHPGAIHPWARQPLGDRPLPTVLDNSNGIQLERVAALQPDLIIALSITEVDRDDYDKLTRIAPTLVPPADAPPAGLQWQDIQLTVGRAVGQPARTQELVTATETRLAEVKAMHPEFARSTAVFATRSRTAASTPSHRRTRTCS